MDADPIKRELIHWHLDKLKKNLKRNSNEQEITLRIKGELDDSLYRTFNAIEEIHKKVASLDNSVIYNIIRDEKFKKLESESDGTNIVDLINKMAKIHSGGIIKSDGDNRILSDAEILDGDNPKLNGVWNEGDIVVAEIMF